MSFALRLLPILVVLTCTQVGLYLCLKTIYLPRPGQRGARRLLALSMLLGALFLPVYFAQARAGLVLAPWARWLIAYPVLSWHLLSIPLLLVLGTWVSLARRLPSSEEATFASAPLRESRRVVLVRSASALLGGVAVLSGIGLRTQEQAPRLTRREIFLHGLHPDLEGLTLLQLSDVHAGALITEERMAAMARAAAALQPDLVVFTGDLLDMSRHAAEPFARGFAALSGRLGTYAILGNHDYYAGARAAESAVRGMGGKLLRNSGVRIEHGKGSLWLGGVDDPLAFESHSGAVDAERALRGAARGEPRILLAHRPMLFEMCAAAGADFVLSGHTHGGQFALSPRFSMARLITPYTMGHFQRGTAQLYVHRGMGVVAGAPLRLGSAPELALFTLRRA